MIEAVVLILGVAFARYLQGNGYAGIGRWMALPLILAAVVAGPLDGRLHVDQVEPALWMALCLWATIAFGWTRWGEIWYGLLRYGVPVFVGALPLAIITKSVALGWYCSGVTIGLTATYYFLAEHKPDWLTRIVGDRDVAAAVAGAIVGAVVLVG